MKKIALIFIACLVLSLLVSCSPYTVEGTIVGKVYQPANVKSIPTLVGGVVVPRSREVGEKWYIQIAFTDKNGNAKAFYWGVTEEVYNNAVIGSNTPVNVQQDDKILPMFSVSIGVFALVIFLRLIFRKRNKVEDNAHEIVSNVTLSIFGIPLKRRKE